MADITYKTERLGEVAALSEEEAIRLANKAIDAALAGSLTGEIDGVYSYSLGPAVGNVRTVTLDVLT